MRHEKQSSSRSGLKKWNMYSTCAMNDQILGGVSLNCGIKFPNLELNEWFLISQSLNVTSWQQLYIQTFPRCSVLKPRWDTEVNEVSRQSETRLSGWPLPRTHLWCRAHYIPVHTLWVRGLGQGVLVGGWDSEVPWKLPPHTHTHIYDDDCQVSGNTSDEERGDSRSEFSGDGFDRWPRKQFAGLKATAASFVCKRWAERWKENQWQST